MTRTPAAALCAAPFFVKQDSVGSAAVVGVVCTALGYDRGARLPRMAFGAGRWGQPTYNVGGNCTNSKGDRPSCAVSGWVQGNCSHLLDFQMACCEYLCFG